MIFNDMQKIGNSLKNHEKLFNLLKFIWAVLIFYFWIKLCVHNLWVEEDFSSENFYEWNETSVVDLMDEDLKNELNKHDVAADEQEQAVDVYSDYDWQENEYKLKFQNMCIANMSFCSKIKFQSEFTYKDKYMYLASAIYVLNFIGNNAQIGAPIKDQLKSISISSASNSRRWFANRSTVTLNLWSVKSYTEFMELVTHELWHIVDLWVIKWYSSKMDSVYTEFGKKVFAVDDASLEYYALSWQSENTRKSTSQKADFCSSYGMSDPFEDFAECQNLYLNHNAIFKAWAQQNDIMKQKYNFFANLYGGKYMFASSADVSRYNVTSWWRPWDSTRM